MRGDRGVPVKSTIVRLLILTALVATAGFTELRAQPMPHHQMRGAGGMRGPGGIGPGPDLMRELFPPELVMRYQTEINLSEDQKKSIVKETQALQSDLVPLQFDMGEAAGKLKEALAAPKIDEEKASALADRLMTLESRIKKRHLALMIRIKNILTPEQQSQLRELRKQWRTEGERGRMGRHPGGPPPDGEEPPPSDEPESMSGGPTY
jgi:Spy/CpxP family protein refolding chaperone